MVMIIKITTFQSTLPRGSDTKSHFIVIYCHYFNPRSLAGATSAHPYGHKYSKISIHAPSRERLSRRLRSDVSRHFNPRSLAGATQANIRRSVFDNFNPRSLAGAILSSVLLQLMELFQSTLPRGSEASKQITSLFI